MLSVSVRKLLKLLSVVDVLLFFALSSIWLRLWVLLLSVELIVLLVLLFESTACHKKKTGMKGQN